MRVYDALLVGCLTLSAEMDEEHKLAETVTEYVNMVRTKVGQRLLRAL
jgi:hypothetical protein